MLTSILKKLIRFRTISSDTKENQRALLWIKNYLEGLPLVIREYKFNDFPSLVATTRNKKKVKILLQAHIDVVAGSPKQFFPSVKTGRLYGRGVFDMKFAVACFLRLFRNLGRNLKNYDLGIMITSDEEIGGYDGVGKLLAKGYDAEVCILPDGGENWSIQRSAKGVYRVEVISRGKSGHGSRPWVGINAIEQLNNFLVRIRKKFPEEPCWTKNHLHETLNIGVIRGGESVNQIPDLARASLDIRFTYKSSKAKLRSILQRETRDFPGIILREVQFSSPYSLDTKDPFLRLYTNIVRTRVKGPVKFIDSHGSSDAKFLIPRGITTILTRPVGGNLHGENEWVDLRSLETFYSVLEEFVRRVG